MPLLRWADYERDEEVLPCNCQWPPAYARSVMAP